MYHPNCITTYGSLIRVWCGFRLRETYLTYVFMHKGFTHKSDLTLVSLCVFI